MELILEELKNLKIKAYCLFMPVQEDSPLTELIFRIIFFRTITETAGIIEEFSGVSKS